MQAPVTTRSSGVPGRPGIDDQQQRVRGGADEGGQRDEAPRIDPVGESQQCARDAADHEAGLHAARQRRLRESGQPVLRDERGNDRGCGEPKRHRRDLAERDDRDRRDLRLGHAKKSPDFETRRRDGSLPDSRATAMYDVQVRGCRAAQLGSLPARVSADGRDLAPATHCRERTTVSDLGQRDALLALVLAAAVLVRRLADLVRLEEDHLRDAFVGVDLRRQRRRVRELERDVPFPLRLERRDVDDDAAARVGATCRGRRSARCAECGSTRPCARARTNWAG